LKISGQKCLTVFGKILNTQSDIPDPKAMER